MDDTENEYLSNSEYHDLDLGTGQQSSNPVNLESATQKSGKGVGVGGEKKNNNSFEKKLNVVNIAQTFVENNTSQSEKDVFMQKLRQKFHKKGDAESMETKFRTACKNGDLKTADDMLSLSKQEFDMNHRDQRGFTALAYAIRNEQEDVVTRLLKERDVNLTDSLHCAVEAGNFSATISLLQRGADPNQIARTSVYPKGSSPLLLACHSNNVDVVQLLLDFKAKRLEMPVLDGSSLGECRYRLDLVKALACPAYIVLTSQDPVMQAFEMSQLCRRLKNAEVEFAEEYSELEEKCEKLAADLVNAVDNSEDIMVLLSLKKKRASNKTVVGDPLCRLHYALEHNHKLFVSHAHCQQALSDKYFQGFKNWRHKSTSEKLTIITLLFVLCPVWLIVYVTLPPTRLDYYLEYPLMKAVANFACYAAVLIMLISIQVNMAKGFVLAQDEIREEYNMILDKFEHGANIEWVETFVFAWVLGKVWTEVSEIRNTGVKSYVRDYWHLMDFFMNSVFIVAFMARFVDATTTADQAFQIVNLQPSILFKYTIEEDDGEETTKQNPENLDETPQFRWHLNDPLMVYQSMLGVGSLLAFVRIIWWFRASQQLGKLQMMLGASFGDIFKFFFLYIVIYLGFAGAINAVYWKFIYLVSVICKASDPVVNCNEELAAKLSGDQMPFLTLTGCLYQLYWTTFGYASNSYTDKLFDNWTLNEIIGSALFIIYNFLTTVILLNVLIGMITKTLDNIESNIDIEWKFVRSQIYSRFIEAEECAPPPFNIIPTVRKVIKYGSLIIYKFTHNQKYLIWAKPKQEAVLKQREALVARFPGLLEEMRERYLRDMEREDEGQQVTQDDIQNVKNDISSLRFELLDAFDKNSAREKIRQEAPLAGTYSVREEKMLDVQQQDRALMQNLMSVLEINSRVMTRLLGVDDVIGAPIWGPLDFGETV